MKCGRKAALLVSAWEIMKPPGLVSGTMFGICPSAAVGNNHHPCATTETHHIGRKWHKSKGQLSPCCAW